MKYNQPCLSDFEICVLDALLAGDEYEMRILRSQLKSVLLAARHHDTALWGVIPRPSVCIRRCESTTYFDPACWYELGERRKLVLDDVVAEIGARRFLRIAVECENGGLSSLRILGEASGPGKPLSTVTYRTDEIAAISVHYVKGPPSTLGQFIEAREQSYRRQLGAYPFVEPQTPWQEYLANLDNFHIPHPHAETAGPEWREVNSVPLGVSWAAPAKAGEIDGFEAKYGVILADDIRDLWRFTNGMVVLWWAPILWNCRGTYDSTIWEGENKRWVYLIDRAAGDSTCLCAAAGHPSETRQPTATVGEFDFGDDRPYKTWGCFRD